MNLAIVTKQELSEFKLELVEEIKKILSPKSEPKEWLKSKEVKRILSCSAGTLQNLRTNGKLPFSKVGGSIYYAYEDVMKVLRENKRELY